MPNYTACRVVNNLPGVITQPRQSNRQPLGLKRRDATRRMDLEIVADLRPHRRIRSAEA